MKSIRLGIIFDQKIRAGGGYQQALNAALLTRNLSSELCEPIFFSTLEENIFTLARHGIHAESIRLSFFQKIRTYFRRLVSDYRFFKFLKRFERYSPFEMYLVKRKIDLVYFLSPNNWALDLEITNYITTVWDLCHRDEPEFPEVRTNRQFEVRERSYSAILPRATAIFVDSEIAKVNIIYRYSIDDTRVHVMPFQAAADVRDAASSMQSFVDVHEKYNLDLPYVFYPAQFWPHKNHVYLLEGLSILERRHDILIGAIFSGGDQGNLAHIEACVRKLNLEDRVRFIGFVSNEEIPELYRHAFALVMPSYFGPTNLPPLEGFKLGVPVLYPDKAGMRDQVGDAALLMDLSDPGSMADHIKHLIDDPQLRSRLIEAGKERLTHFDSIDRVAILSRVLEDFRWKRLTWQ